MTTIGQQVQETLIQDTKWLGNLLAMLNLIRDSGLYDDEAYVCLQTYCFSDSDLPYLKISPTSELGMAELAKKLLPFVGKFEKRFDEERNHVMLTGMYSGFKVILWDDTPKTCRVKKVEEDVLVPEKIVPAHTEKRIRYKLIGDCDPVLAEKAVEANG